MENKKKHFVWYDYKLTLLLAVAAYFYGFGIFISDLITNSDNSLCNVILGVFVLTIPIWIVLFLTLTNRYKIENNIYKSGLCIKRKLDLDKVTNITYNKTLHLHYRSKKGKDKKHTLFLFGLVNNKEKYANLITDIIYTVNEIGNINIDLSGEEMINSIYTNRTKHLVTADGEPLNRGGWFYVWYVYIIYMFCHYAWNTYTSYNAYIGCTYRNIMEYRIPIKSTVIVALILAIVYLAIFIISLIKRKSSVKIIIYLTYLIAIILTLDVAWLIYFTSSLYEPSVFKVTIILIYKGMAVLNVALIQRRYFTTSVRIKNTYIK